jgi:hypothetical protein
MSQPKDPPLSIRPGGRRLDLIDKFAAANGLTRHSAILVLIDRSLVAEEPARVARAPTVAELPDVRAKAPIPPRSAEKPKIVNRLKGEWKAP